MSECLFCELLKDKSRLLYENEKAAILMHPEPFAKGHLLVVPKAHIPILEQLPDELASHLFVLANKASIAQFEALQVLGTNILIDNGLGAGQSIAHFSISVIPRSDKDGMDFNWTPKMLSEEQMSTVEMALKEQLEKPEEKEEKPKEEKTKEKKAVLKEEKGKTNYLLKQLNRLT